MPPEQNPISSSDNNPVIEKPNWRKKYPVIWALIVSFIVYTLLQYVLKISPETMHSVLYFPYMIITYFVIPIYFFSTVYRSITNKSAANIRPMETESVATDPKSINDKQAKILLTLLALELPMLLLLSFIFIKNGFSVTGDYGFLVFIFGLTLFVPNIIAFLIFALGYIKNTTRNWSQLSKYSVAGFLLFWVQLIIYFKILVSF